MISKTKSRSLSSFLEVLYGECLGLAKRKNHDYATANSTDDLKNFKLVEFLGVTRTSTGVLVRMCDKVSRIATLGGKEGEVSESLRDTVKDLINYAGIYLFAKEKEDGKP